MFSAEELKIWTWFAIFGRAVQQSQIPFLYSILPPLNNDVLSACYILNQKQSKNKLCLLETVNIYKHKNVKQEHFKMASRKRVLLLYFTHSCGEGNGNPLQYSCLENPMDRGAWWAPVHGVTKSRRQLSDHTYTHTHSYIFKISLSYSYVFVLLWKMFWKSYTNLLPVIMYTQKGQVEYGRGRAFPGHLTLQ